MPVAMTYPHIEKTGDEPARLQRLPRVRVAQIVMDYLAHGWSADEICRQHRHLLPAEVHAALAYYFDHRAEIEREIEEEMAQADQSATDATSPAFLARLKAKASH